MIRIGIFGVESTHTDLFIRIAEEYDDVCVAAISGETPELTEKFKKSHNLKCEYVEPERLAELSNLILITVRDGAKHRKCVERCVKNGCAVWIDKPFTASVKDAQWMTDFFEENNITYAGGTCVRYTKAILDMKKYFDKNRETCLSGYVSYKVYLDGPYSGIHFYSHHAIESMLYVFGTGVKSVFAKRTDENLSVIAGYEGFNVIINYAVGAMPFFCGIFGESGVYSSCVTKEEEKVAWYVQFEEMIEMVRSKKSPQSRDFFITAVKVSNAIVKSMNEKIEVTLSE